MQYSSVYTSLDISSFLPYSIIIVTKLSKFYGKLVHVKACVHSSTLYQALYNG